MIAEMMPAVVMFSGFGICGRVLIWARMLNCDPAIAPRMPTMIAMMTIAHPHSNALFHAVEPGHSPSDVTAAENALTHKDLHPSARPIWVSRQAVLVSPLYRKRVRAESEGSA